MRLLKLDSDNKVRLTEDFSDNVPRYAILSHTWGADADEVTFADLQNGLAQQKVGGYSKIMFCGQQAKKDEIHHFWVDTCCIDKANLSELSEAITSMFCWYRDAAKCYVYLSDVSSRKRDSDALHTWKSSIQTSRWFTRGWTLQELLAPTIVEFFSREHDLIGDKNSLAQQIHDITDIPVTALHGMPLPQFSVAERMRWAEKRQTKKKEDRAYCLLGIFEVYMPLIYGEGDHAFTRLQKEINERSGLSKLYTNTLWLVRRTANSLFTGREEILQRLEKIVRDVIYCPGNQPQCRIVISGMGGQGKSEICLQLARRLRQLFKAVLWVDVSSQDGAERSFLEAAQRLSIPAQSWEDAVMAIANLQYPWLLVLDNADELDVDYQNYFPDGQHSVIIMTTRNNDCQQYSTNGTIALECLYENEARDLLLKASRIPLNQHSQHEAAAKTVANLLQSHPLALIQAGAYVARGHCKLAEYPRLYNRQRQRLLTFRPGQAQSRYRDVYATFEVSIGMLVSINTQEARDALELLSLLAVCEPSQLPLDVFKAAWEGAKNVPLNLEDNAEDEEVRLLTTWHVARLPLFLEPLGEVWDPFRITEATALLRTFCLLSVGTQKDYSYVWMHALVHAWARDRLSDNEHHLNWVRMSCTMAFALEQDNLNWEQKRWMQSHVERITDGSASEMFYAEPPMLIGRILVNCGWYLHDMRADAKLFALLEKIHVHLGFNRSKVILSWTGLFELTARNLVTYGHDQEAVSLLEDLVEIRQQSLAEDDPGRLALQHVLAMAYQANGQIGEAVPLLEKVVEIQRQSLAESHPDRLTSQNELAKVYEANGQIREAIKILEHVVRVKDLVEDRFLWVSQHALARAYRLNGQVEEAIMLFEKVMETQNNILAEHHPDRLASQHELAAAYRDDYQIEKAVLLLEEVVETRQLLLAEGHPSRLSSEHELASIYGVCGQVEKAIPMLEKIVKIRERVLAQDNLNRLASQVELAGVYRSNGQVKEAIILLEGVAEIQKQSLAKDHPARLASQHELAGAYRANGQVKKAVILFENVVEIQKQSLARDHPAQLISQHELAGAYHENGQIQEAVTLLQEVVDIQGISLANDHPSQLESQHNLAVYLWSNGQLEMACSMMEQVVSIRRQVLDEHHPDRRLSEEGLAYYQRRMAILGNIESENLSCP